MCVFIQEEVLSLRPGAGLQFEDGMVKAVNREIIPDLQSCVHEESLIIGSQVKMTRNRKMTLRGE